MNDTYWSHFSDFRFPKQVNDNLVIYRFYKIHYRKCLMFYSLLYKINCLLCITLCTQFETIFKRLMVRYVASIMRPPRSPDLNPCNIFIWGSIESTRRTQFWEIIVKQNLNCYSNFAESRKSERSATYFPPRLCLGLGC